MFNNDNKVLHSLSLPKFFLLIFRLNKKLKVAKK